MSRSSPQEVRFQLASVGEFQLTRAQGAPLRMLIEETIDSGATVVIDFAGTTRPAPSFIDEVLGRLMLNLGESTFKESVRLDTTTVTEEVQRLTNKVISYRLQQFRAGIRGGDASPDGIEP